MGRHPMSKIRAFSHVVLTRLVLGLACALAAGAACAEKADTGRPMNIEADALRYDDLKQISVFTGNVVLTRGSIVVKGARVEVRQDPQGYQYGVVTGEPGQRAYFRQKRDEAADEYIEGEAQTIEYDGRADLFKLVTDAQMRRLRGTQVVDTVSGKLIQYNSLADIFTVDGGAQKGGERVRATLTPPQGADAGAAHTGAGLRSDDKLSTKPR
jgi:lipopolysaccharide export system protein LptA